MLRALSTVVLACGLGVTIMGCQSDSSGTSTAATPSGSPAGTPQGNMQGPAHSNGSEGADTAMQKPNPDQSMGDAANTNSKMSNQGRVPTTMPQQ